MSARLYRDAQAKQARLKAAQRAKDSELDFKPRLHTRQRRRGQPTTPETSENRFDSLYRQAVSQRERRAAAKSLDPECSFKPKTNKSKSGTPDQLSGQARLDRLHAAAGERELRLELERRRKSPNGCTFSPNLEATARRRERIVAVTGGSLGDRLYRDAQAKSERLAQARLAKEQNQRFTPKTNRSRQTSKARRSLYPDPADVKQRQLELQLERESREMDGCTFSPVIERGADVASASALSLSDGVHDRLYSEAFALRDRKEKLRVEHEEREREVVTFRPTTHIMDGEEGDGEVFERLYDEAKEQREAREKAMADAELERLQSEVGDCTFEPKVSSVDPSLTPFGDGRTSTFERLYSEASLRDRKREELAEASAIKLKQDFSFHPAISHRPKNKIALPSPAAPATASDRSREERPQSGISLRPAEGMSVPSTSGALPPDPPHSISDGNPSSFVEADEEPVLSTSSSNEIPAISKVGALVDSSPLPEEVIAEKQECMPHRDTSSTPEWPNEPGKLHQDSHEGSDDGGELDMEDLGEDLDELLVFEDGNVEEAPTKEKDGTELSAADNEWLEDEFRAAMQTVASPTATDSVRMEATLKAAKERNPSPDSASGMRKKSWQ